MATTIPTASKAESEILSVRGVSKAFPGVVALQEVDFSLRSGEVHALVGENGAGKSTLMKILSGAYRKDRGAIAVAGGQVEVGSPQAAQALGISTIHQEFNLVPALSVAENIFLGRLPVRSRWGLLDRGKLRREAAALLKRLGLAIPPETPVSALRVAQQQLVEIAKALSTNARILIMDEPTAALNEAEVVRLFAIIRDLRRDGVGIIYISHKLEEVFALADRITVFRDGRRAGTYPAGGIDRNSLIRLMVGREVTDLFPRRDVSPGGAVLELRHVDAGMLRDINFTLEQGEVLGVAGLMGAGQMPLARVIFGVEPKRSGTILVNGWPVSVTAPAEAIRQGIGLLTENRKEEGLILGLSVAKNVALASIDTVSRWGMVTARREQAVAREYIDRLRIRTPGVNQKVRFLSGGNQQKVVLAKWLNTAPEILVLCEPTRGIDVGAKAEIYQLINELAAGGKAILFISSELPEILGLSDRILVMHEGRIAACLQREEATAEKIMFHATGLSATGSRAAGGDVKVADADGGKADVCSQ